MLAPWRSMTRTHAAWRLLASGAVLLSAQLMFPKLERAQPDDPNGPAQSLGAQLDHSTAITRPDSSKM